MKAIQLSHIPIILSELSVVKTVRGKEHQNSILNQVNEFYAR